MKLKMVHGLHDEGQTRVLGQYLRHKDLIEIHVDDIKAHAVAYGDYWPDLMELVVLHEKGHRALRDMQLSEAQEEKEADSYAFWTFYKTHGRTPVVDKAWRHS